MNQRNIQYESKIWVENLIYKLEQNNIQNLLAGYFETNIEVCFECQDMSPKAKSSSLYSNLINLKHFPHSIGKKYTKDQILVFKNLINKYHKNLLSIRNYLKFQNHHFRD